MRVNAPSKRRKYSQGEGKEPNLIPIMNLFLVLIPALMTMMVVTHLAMIGIDYTSSSGGGDNKDEPKLDKITLKILMNGFDLMIGEEDPYSIAAIDSTANLYDMAKLDEKLNEIKEENQEQNVIFIMTDPDVIYDILLRSIDLCKMNGFPNVKYIPVHTALKGRA